MRKRLWMTAILCVALTGRGALALYAPEDQPDMDGSKALAERFALTAQQTLLVDEFTRGTLQQSAALLEAACRLDPKMPRFRRLLADTYLQLNDVPDAITSLKGYLACNDDTKADELAQAQLVDLYLGQMESADQKIAYCQGVEGTAQIPEQVRSHAALSCAALLLSQSANEQAMTELDNALKLSNKLNIGALRMKWDLTAASATPAQRIELLLDMVHANPSDPVVMTRLAEQSANVGLVEDSVGWYNEADLLYSRLGGARDGSFARGFAAELAFAGHDDDAMHLLTGYLKAAPYDAEGWFMAMSILQSGAGSNKLALAEVGKLKQQAAVALLNNLAEIRKMIGVTGATTRPVESTDKVEIPDLSNDYALLQKSADAALIDAYINAASNLAWYELFYQHDSSTAGLILPTLEKLLGDSDVVLTRLEGWKDLVDTKADTAAAKLASVQDRDPYAALGVYANNEKVEANHDQNMKLAGSLIAAHPTGATGLVLWESLRSTGLSIVVSDKAVKNELDGFNIDFLRIIQEPSLFYAIRAEPIKATYAFGEPVLVRVTLTNVGRYDLTIGGDGVIHPDLWFDARMKGEVDSPVPGVAFDKIGGRLVLAKDESISTIARVDGGVLTQIFMGNSERTLIISMSVTTNPLTLTPKDAKDRPQAIAGPAGYRMDFTNMFQRTATPMAVAMARGLKVASQGLLNAAQGSDPGKKYLALQSMALTIISASPDARQIADVKTVLDQFTNQIRVCQSDPLLPIRTWAKYWGIMISKDQAKGDEFAALADSKDWTDEMMALVLSTHLSDRGLDLATRFSRDSDPTVAAMGRATLVVLASHPATQPSTGPSTVPSTPLPAN